MSPALPLDGDTNRPRMLAAAAPPPPPPPPAPGVQLLVTLGWHVLVKAHWRYDD